MVKRPFFLLEWYFANEFCTPVLLVRSSRVHRIVGFFNGPHKYAPRKFSDRLGFGSFSDMVEDTWGNQQQLRALYLIDFMEFVGVRGAKFLSTCVMGMYLQGGMHGWHVISVSITGRKRNC